MSNKHCPCCHCSTDVIKYGITCSGKQKYKCRKCGKTWTNKSRKQRLVNKIWHDFVWNNLPVRELAIKYSLHENTIRKILHDYKPKPLNIASLPEGEKNKITVIAMDTTYFGRNSGVVAAINAHNGDLLYFKEIFGSETNKDYELCINTLLEAGIHPKACIIDGRQGVRYLLEDKGILVQLCQFHLKLMVKKYLTNNPVLEPNKELKLIIDSVCNKHIHMDERSFLHMFVNWHGRYVSWLNEKTIDPVTGNKEWTHQDTRRAFNAIKNHLDIIYTYEHYPELNIPSTSNRIEGKFGVAKDKLRIHHGYTKDLKIKILFSLLSGE